MQYMIKDRYYYSLKESIEEQAREEMRQRKVRAHNKAKREELAFWALVVFVTLVVVALLGEVSGFTSSLIESL